MMTDYYRAGNIEAIDAIEAAVTGLEGIEAHCIGTAIKYLFRSGMKGAASGTPRRVNQEDIRKAIWYLERLL